MNDLPVARPAHWECPLCHCSLVWNRRIEAGIVILHPEISEILLEAMRLHQDEVCPNNAAIFLVDHYGDVFRIEPLI